MNEKLQDQKSLLIQLKSEFDENSAPDGQKWTESDIEMLLKKLPVAIFNQGNKQVEAMVKMKLAKQELRKIFTKKLLEANYDSDLKAANERKAWAENQDEYLEAEENLILAEGEYKAAELHYTAYDNLFTAVKKASAIVTQQNLNQIR